MVSWTGERRRPPCGAAAVLGLLLSAVGPAAAEAADAAEKDRGPVVVLDEECLECAVALTREWSYQPGDDPAWADPAFDDSAWPLVAPALDDLEAVPGGWSGIGWFRRRIRTTAGFGDHPLGLRMRQAGASEVFLDGRQVARFGTVSTSPADERPTMPLYVTALHLEPDVEYVLAVRYSNATGHVIPRGFRGFEVVLGEMRHVTAEEIRHVRGYTAFMSGGVGLFGAFALVHLLLFAFRPKEVDNLFFALFNGSVLAILLAELQMNALSDLDEALVFYKLLVSLTIVMALSGLLLELRLFKRRIGRPFLALVVLAAGVVVWTWTLPVFRELLPHGFLVLFVFLVMLWLAVQSLIRREREAWVIGVGYLILALAVFTNELRAFGLIELPWMILPIVGLGSLAASFSVYLTRRMAHTNQELEERLHEVQRLTDKTIEQERWAAQEEAERRLLEADNERKTAELEEARELQLEMLPKELPRLAGFDFAVRMTTANEVGGDYYDFATNGDSGCTVAVGDATGHGLQAGMVVAVVKSLFQTASREPCLSAVLQRIDAGLGTIHRRAASMAMVLVRLEDHRLRVASAGMPPVLVWRHSSGELEELLLPGAPLGTALANGEYREREVDLDPGDAALIMTDGLVEAANPDGDTLGYDLAGRLFAESAGLEPEAIIDRLVTQVRLFLGGRPLGDDMTLLALKASG
jgi:serine phosphatase RsbU (regulator of sigma subunit)